MTSSLTRAASALLASAALVAGSAASASAATWIHHDATHDVRRVDLTSDTPTIGRAPGQASVDITRVRITHGAGKVVVGLHTRGALPRSFNADYRVNTPRGKYEIMYSTSRGFTITGMIRSARPGPVTCPQLDANLLPGRGLLILSVPRRCLGGPAWVRVGVGMDSTRRQTAFTDDALSGGLGRPSALGTPQALSPRIRARG